VIPRPYLAAVVHEPGHCAKCGRPLATVYRVEFPDGTHAAFGSECYRTVLPPSHRSRSGYRGSRKPVEVPAPSLFDENDETE
jgi:hypothetical protein